MSDHRTVGFAVLLVGMTACSEAHERVDGGSGDGLDGRAGCDWLVGEVHPLTEGTNLSFDSHGGLAGLAWDGARAWVVTLSLPESQIWLHRLDAEGSAVAPPGVVDEQPLWPEAYVDVVFGEDSGLVVYNGCAAEGCGEACPEYYFECTPRYAPRARTFAASGDLAPSQLLAGPRSFPSPQVAS